MRVVIIRHGERDDYRNKDDYKFKFNNSDLTEEGIKELRIKWTKYFYNNKLNNLGTKPSVIYTSPFIRTIQTAEVIKSCFELVYNETIKIINYTSLSEALFKVSENELIENSFYKSQLFKFLSENHINYPESIKRIIRRSINSINNIINHNQNRNVFIVSHGLLCGSMATHLSDGFTKYSQNECRKFRFKFGAHMCFEKQFANFKLLEADGVMFKGLSKSIIDFWFPKPGFIKEWFKKDEKFDKEIKDKFEWILNSIKLGYDILNDTVQEKFAKIIVCDQFSRNIYRNGHDSIFDTIARLECLELIDSKYKFDFQKYSFILLPLRHSKEKKYIEFVKQILDTLETNNYTVENKIIYNKFYRKTSIDLNNCII